MVLTIMALIVSIDSVWIAHFLLLSLFLCEAVSKLLQLVYYRRGN